MKLNYDCLRELLINIENFHTLDDKLSYHYMNLDEMIKAMPDFSKVDIAYATLKAKEAGMINVSILNADNEIYSCTYSSLTYDGHQFLDDIRSNNVWEKTKCIAKEIGCSSVKALSSIAGKVVLQLISSQL